MARRGRSKDATQIVQSVYSPYVSAEVLSLLQTSSQRPQPGLSYFVHYHHVQTSAPLAYFRNLAVGKEHGIEPVVAALTSSLGPRARPCRGRMRRSMHHSRGAKRVRCCSRCCHVAEAWAVRHTDIHRRHRVFDRWSTARHHEYIGFCGRDTAHRTQVDGELEARTLRTHSGVRNKGCDKRCAASLRTVRSPPLARRKRIRCGEKEKHSRRHGERKW